MDGDEKSSMQEMARTIAEGGCSECAHKDLAESLRGPLRGVGVGKGLEESHREGLLTVLVYDAVHRSGETQRNVKRLLDQEYIRPFEILALWLSSRTPTGASGLAANDGHPGYL